MVPEGFMAELPGRKRSFDMQFISHDSKVRIYVYSFSYDGTIEDQTEDLLEFYGDEMTVTKEEAKTTFLRTFMQFRLAIVVLNLVPYVALKIMAGA